MAAITTFWEAKNQCLHQETYVVVPRFARKGRGTRPILAVNHVEWRGEGCCYCLQVSPNEKGQGKVFGELVLAGGHWYSSEMGNAGLFSFWLGENKL